MKLSFFVQCEQDLLDLIRSRRLLERLDLIQLCQPGKDLFVHISAGFPGNCRS